MVAARLISTAAVLVGLFGAGCSPAEQEAGSDRATTEVAPLTAPTGVSIRETSSPTASTRVGSPSSVETATSSPTVAAPTVAAPIAPPATTAPPPTGAPPTVAAPLTSPALIEQIGTSVNGLPITAMRRGTPGGVVVVVVGSIHGNEESGMRITAALGDAPVPDGVELWLIDTINPDGVAVGQRRNARGVDLNRNFPGDWTPIIAPAGQYSGPGPASEPETQAFVAFAESIKPALTIWYHEDLNAIAPSTGVDWPLRLRYSALSGVPIGQVTQPGGIYTGTAAKWTRSVASESMSFVIELPDTLTDEQLAANTAALLAITAMVPGPASSG